MQTPNKNNRFFFINKKMEMKKEKFARTAKYGIKIAGKTSKLDNI